MSNERELLGELFDEWFDDYFSGNSLQAPSGQVRLWLKNAYLAGAVSAATEFDFCMAMQQLAVELGIGDPDASVVPRTQ